jgi:pimeloyl-[acyl-carrier protein] methyl ester esterase
MSVMTLSGWGQPHDSLASLAPEAMHVDYAHHRLEDALAHIAQAGQSKRTIIGWSLGGQLAVRAIAAGLLRPQKLVLIAVPFQFVVSEEKKLGMKRDLYDKFRDNYARNPERTLSKAWELVLKDDARQAAMRERLARHDKASVLEKDWLYWLDALDGFSFDGLSFAHFPPTLIIHGKKDAVVEHEQHAHFAQRIPAARVVSLDECGHAPHWHAADALREEIDRHV